MKRILSLLITLALVFTFFGLATTSVEAETVACTTNQTVFVHYHRWDETYTDTTIWTWGYGTGGSGEGGGVVEEDGFGAVYQICVADDSDNNLGLINKYGAGWGDGSNDRDAVDTDENGSKDGNHKEIMVKDDNGFVGFTDGVKHVYVFEGSNQVIYADDANSLPYSDDVATVAVIYFDLAQSYDDWNIWTWGTGTLGTQLNENFYDGSGVPFVSALGVDGGTVENLRVAFINVDPADMATELGFIVRTDAWEKKFASDMFIQTDGLVAGDFVTTFYIAGEGVFYDTFQAFDEAINRFEIEAALALDPNSVEVTFNKDVITMVDGEYVFSDSSLIVKDKNGEKVTVKSVSYNSTTEVNNVFTIITEDALTGMGSPYTVYYLPGGSDLYTKSFQVDSQAPTITIIGSKNVTKELGDTYSLPTYSASDMVGEESVAIYDVMIKDGFGTVDTRNAGIYEIVIVAYDKFGNMAEETITVTVTDPCDDQAHLNANAGFNTNLLALFVGIPLAFGAFVTLRKGV